MSKDQIYWQVQVTGHAFDLDHLVRNFKDQPRRMVKDERDGSYSYESVSFNACSTSAEVLAIAEQELQVLSGVLRVGRGTADRLRPGAVYRRTANGGRDVFVHVSDTLRLRMDVGEATVILSGENRPAPPPRTVEISRLASNDPTIAKALRLLSASDSRSWVGLYRIYEVVEADVGGEKQLQTLGWISSTILRRFKHSANSVAVGGDQSRHGKELTVPPLDPMSLDEADGYVTSLLSTWLSSKGA